MANFGKKLQDATEDELMDWINNLDFRVVPLASDELTRRALKDLNAAIEETSSVLKKLSDSTEAFNTETSAQTNKMVHLTRMVTFLTLVLVLGLFIQLWIAWPKDTQCTVSTSNTTEHCTTIYGKL